MNYIDLRRVDLNLLVIFDTLMAERHVGRTAQRLSLSQSAVSHALARLRELFDDPLFARHPKGIEPTRRSLALAPQVSDVLERTRAVFAATPSFDPSRPHRFTIGQTDGSIPILVPLIERMRKAAPKIELTVRRVDATGVVTAIDRQDLDLAFAVMSSAVPARIASIPVFGIHYVCIARRGHPALQARLSPQAFAALPHLSVTPHDQSTSRVADLLADAGLRRNVVMTVPHFLAAPMIIARTDLVAVLDRSIARLFASERKLAVFDVPAILKPLTIDLLIASVRSEEPALRWLIDQCIQVCRPAKGEI
jgi:DNA-binding transcriptional LysR family regulator